MFADLIFPIFTTPYFLFFGFFPLFIVVALASEFMVFKGCLRGPSWKAIAFWTVMANVFSWLIGAFVSSWIPNIISAHGNDLHQLIYPASAVLLAFGVAYALSVLLEGLVWKFALRKTPGLAFWKATAFANAASYGLLLAVFFFYNHFSFEFTEG